MIHSAAHNWEDQGGHRGEHGSLGVVQARAPFVIAGKGVRNDGLVPRARPAGRRRAHRSPSCSACAPARRRHATSRGQDGVVRDDVLDVAGGRPRHVVGFLFDGANPNVLYDMAARGEAPNVARLIDDGHGVRARRDGGAADGHARQPHVDPHRPPTPATTASSTTRGTTARRGEQVITNSQATWPWAMDHLTAGVETLHDAVHRTWPDAFTASVNEPCDIGADYSTFDFFRRGEVPPIPKAPDGLPHTTERFVRPSKDYSWSSVVDHMGIEQAVGIWSGDYRDQSYPLPAVHVVQLHAHRLRVPRGRAALRDRRRRRCATPTRASARCSPRSSGPGVFDDTAFVLVADHGMEETDPAVSGDWDVALREAGRRRSATRATASSTSATTSTADDRLTACADGLADPEGDRGDDRADERHAQPGAARVPTGEDRGGRTDGEQRQHRDDAAATIVGAVPLPNRNGMSGIAAPTANATNDEPAATHGDPSWSAGRARAPRGRACRARRRCGA